MKIIKLVIQIIFKKNKNKIRKLFKEYKERLKTLLILENKNEIHDKKMLIYEYRECILATIN